MTTTAYLTTTEAAQLRGLSAARIRRLCLDGRLPGAERRGRDWLIPRASMLAWQPRPNGRPGHMREEER